MAKAGRKQKGLYKRDLLQEQAENKSFQYQGNYLVYGLVSSERPLAFRYIGFTGDSLNRRYNEHLADISKENTEKENTEKEKWVKSVLASGHRLMMVVVEDGIQTQGEVCEAEKAYIKGFIDAGAELTNMTMGGIGTEGLTHKAETKEKQRQARISKVEERREIKTFRGQLAA